MVPSDDGIHTVTWQWYQVMMVSRLSPDNGDVGLQTVTWQCCQLMIFSRLSPANGAKWWWFPDCHLTLVPSDDGLQNVTWQCCQVMMVSRLSPENGAKWCWSPDCHLTILPSDDGLHIVKTFCCVICPYPIIQSLILSSNCILSFTIHCNLLFSMDTLEKCYNTFIP